MTNLFDHKFTPFQDKDGTRVVADEAEWEKPVEWNKNAGPKLAGECHDCTRNQPKFYCDCDQSPRVSVPVDLFENYEGPLVDSEGRLGWADGLGWWFGEKPSETAKPLTTADVLARLFKSIDQNTNLDFYLSTGSPESIREMFPVETEYLPDSLPYDHPPKRKENLYLGVDVSDQPSADKRIPELLKCRDLCKSLVLNVTCVGPLDLKKWLADAAECEFCGPISDVQWELESTETEVKQSVCPNCFTSWEDGDSTVSGADSLMSLVTISGESGPNARPCNIQWIRDLIQQCKDAGVEWRVLQLGSDPFVFHPAQTENGMPIESDMNEHLAAKWGGPISDPNGADPSEWPEVFGYTLSSKKSNQTTTGE